MKLQPQKTRIGNYVTNSIGDIFQIETGAYLLYHQNKEWDVNGIPLTEEWLLKFGFRSYDVNKVLKKEFQKENNIAYYHDAFNYNYQDGRLFLDNGNDEGWSVDGKIDYVHKLQNLHYSLTEKELEIK
jgi:hypothetical protein